MKNEAISLLLILLPIGSVVRAKDIFDGMQESRTEAPLVEREPHEDLNLEEEGPQTCVHDVYPKDPIKLDGSSFDLNQQVQKAMKEIPAAPPIPSLTDISSQLANVFQLPRFSEMGAELKSMVEKYRAIVELYVKQWMAVLDKRRTEAVTKMKAGVQNQNKKIRDFFSQKLDEYKDLCLPDSNKCLQSIQKNLESYDLRVNKNMAACNRFAQRQLDQHAEWVENERKLLERPFLKVEGCFEKGHINSGVASCVGNMISNVVKTATDGMKRFSDTMGKVSDSLSDRMGKFQECVVNRKKLLDDGQKRIADKAQDCLRKQKQSDDDDGAALFDADDGF
uniref:Putative gsg5 type mucin n=1 Tax=Psorophora albipes TaxID=869069 RepID=T1DIB5_9DIPT